MTGFEKSSTTCKKVLRLHLEIMLFSIFYHTIKTNKLDLSKQTTITFQGCFFLSIFCYHHNLSSQQDNTQKKHV